jgi:hypothetical protein
MDRRTRQRLVERLNRDAERVAHRFALRYRSIAAERGNVTSRYGHCTHDGEIKIRLRHVVTGQALKYSSLVNTLCHELAHLRHFDHSERFKVFYLELLAFARAEGIYRPAPVRRRVGGAPPRAESPARPTRPVQLGLFEGAGVRRS